MGLNIGELLLELTIEYAIGTALTAARRAAPHEPARMPSTVVVQPTTQRDQTVLSHVPGRVRLLVEELRGDPLCTAAVQTGLGTCPGIVRVSTSALTGTALVHYDPTCTSVAQIRAIIARCLTTASSEESALAAHAG